MFKSEEKSLANDFNPARLSFARKRRGLSKKKLAALIKKDPRSITAFESGEYPPAPETLDELCESLGFQRHFFFGDDIEELNAEGVSFRSLTKLTVGQRNAGLAAGALGAMLYEWLDLHFSLPEVDIPDLRFLSPEQAAIALRQKWEIGQRPIGNVIHLLESKGVIVFSLSEKNKNLDAYSLWKDDRPFIFLNTQKSAEHSRFDAAHELGHLVLHRHGQPNGQKAEEEANAFASAFLMPAESLIGSFRGAGFANMIAVKLRWKVSLFALVVRWHRLGLISDWQYRSLCIELSQFRTDEPEGISRESSLVWSQVLESLRSEGKGKSDLANALGLQNSEIESFIFGLAITGISNQSEVVKSPARGKLRLVT